MKRNFGWLSLLGAILFFTTVYASDGSSVVDPDSSESCRRVLTQDPIFDPALTFPLETYSMLPEYKREPLKYFNKTDRAQFLVDWGPLGPRLKNRFLDTDELSGQNIKVLYVMDADGKIYVDIEDKLHHSQILAGSPVAGAGYLSFFSDGTILIDNLSGHYEPPTDSLRQVIGVFVLNGVDLKRIKAKWFSSRTQDKQGPEIYTFLVEERKIRGRPKRAKVRKTHRALEVLKNFISPK